MRMTWKSTGGVAMVLSLCLVTQAYSQVGQQARERNPLQGKAAGQQKVCLATKIEGMTVKDKENQSIGTIQDLVIDESGQVQYLAVNPREQAAGGTRTPRTQPGRAGVDQNVKLTLIPFELAQFHEGETQAQNYASVNLDKDRIMQAPSFTRTQLASQAQQSQWMSQVDKFFDRQKGNVARPNLNNRKDREEKKE